MAELIIEHIDFDSLSCEIITENVNGMPKKNMYITGPHLDSEVKNGNGRMYPKAIIEREVKRLNETKIKQNRLMGELNHPNNVEINLERVSHITKELRMEGNIGYGKSMLLDTPMGKIAQALGEGGVKLGVSSRGVGTLKESVVQNDYNLVCIDIVSDPSGPNCFVDNILESKKEWVFENGMLTEKEMEETLMEVNKIIIENQFSVADRQAATLKLFQDTLKKISMKFV